MKKMMFAAATASDDPQALRQDLQESDSAEMRRRRAVIALNLAGLASMGLVTLLQSGLARRLPEPRGAKVLGRPVKTWEVNSSDTAYGYGTPDGTLALMAHAATIALAAAGDDNRVRDRPWLPVALAVLSGAQAAVAAKYLFHQMPKVDRAWCPYCVMDAVTMVAGFILSIPDAVRALRAD